MNTRARKQSNRVSKHDKDMEKEKNADKYNKRPMNTNGKSKYLNRLQSRRQRKIALQEDVDKLKRKLRHEENVHRALERAFTRPLGALPRLPPYLPSHTLELLAEVAVLEEEVVRLEEQVVNFRQGLYQEAIISSNSKQSGEDSQDLKSNCQISNSEAYISTKPATPTRFTSDPTPIGPNSSLVGNAKKMQRKQTSPNLGKEKQLSPNSSKEKQLSPNLGKENKLNTNLSRNSRQSPVKKVSISRIPTEKQTKTELVVIHKKGSDDIRISKISEKEAKLDSLNEPNKLSEETLKCLMSIFSQMNSSERTEEEQIASPSMSGSSSENLECNSNSGDPYGILEFGNRDIGSYKNFRVFDSCSFRPDLVDSSSNLITRLKILFKKLTTVDLLGLNHQQKLAFWINIYNACMMNAFFEQGIPTSPQMLVALMPKATMNIGGQILSAMTIEHFILRSPYNVKHAYPKGIKDDMTMRGIFALEWPEPLVTFALSCGSYSSPSVRVYTSCDVEDELETAKKNYLQASICISKPNQLAIPKLLHWYLLDFAKDLESLMDWICMQLPDHLRNEAIKSVEMSKNGDSAINHVRVLPYDFKFRYLLAT